MSYTGYVDVPAIMKIGDKTQPHVVRDACQCDWTPCGTASRRGEAAELLHPLKNLNAGDAGVVVTRSEDLNAGCVFS